jgi:signal peptidase I
LVQSELPPADERREVDGNPGEPHPDEAAARIPETVAGHDGQSPALAEQLETGAAERQQKTRAAEAQHDTGAAEAQQDTGAAEAQQDTGAAEAQHDTGAAAGQHVVAPSSLEPELTAPVELFSAPPAAATDSESERARYVDDPGASDPAPPLQISMAGPPDMTMPYGVPAPQPDARTLALESPASRLAQVKEELVAWVKTLVSAAVYAILIVTFGFQVARVEGQSMAPTLEDQDRLIVNKLVYRIGEPRRGDIVMLYYPLNPEKSFVKRVIAEEGDTVRIVDGRVYVNDIPLKDDYVPSEYRSHDDWGPQVIPEGYYFVMGDHRNNSSDSRHWGMVPKKYIIGKVQLRWWPVPSARVF